MALVQDGVIAESVPKRNFKRHCRTESADFAGPNPLFWRFARLKVTVFQDARGQGRGAVEAAVKLAKGDRVQLQQVVLNLILNGIEAMSAVMRQPRVLRVRSQIEGPGDLLIAVEDSGPGHHRRSARSIRRRKRAMQL
jgi:signal transduction histidine kinase